MVRRISMSQINSKIRQAQHRAESQIRQAQRKWKEKLNMKYKNLLINIREK